MKRFNELEIEVISFEIKDVITTSGEGAFDDNGPFDGDVDYVNGGMLN